MFGKTPTCSFPQFRICGPAPHCESLFRLCFAELPMTRLPFGKPDNTEYTTKTHPVRASRIEAGKNLQGLL